MNIYCVGRILLVQVVSVGRLYGLCGFRLGKHRQTPLFLPSLPRRRRRRAASQRGGSRVSRPDSIRPLLRVQQRVSLSLYQGNVTKHAPDPMYFLHSSISGAAYPVVPQNVSKNPLRSHSLVNPKSPSFTLHLSSSSTFSSFRSRCTIPFSCIYATAKHSCPNNARAWLSLNRPFSAR